MPQDTVEFPTAMPSIIHLRQRCLDKVATAANQPLKFRELLVVGTILSDASGGSRTSIVQYAEQDLDLQRLPRFTILQGWLAPYSLVAQYPTAVIRVARYLLGDTIDQEEDKVDWVALRRIYPHESL